MTAVRTGPRYAREPCVSARKNPIRISLIPANAVQPTAPLRRSWTSSSFSVVGRPDRPARVARPLPRRVLEFQLGHELCESERAADVDRRRGYASSPDDRGDGGEHTGTVSPSSPTLPATPRFNTWCGKWVVRRRRSERRCATIRLCGSRLEAHRRLGHCRDQIQDRGLSSSLIAGLLRSWVAGMRCPSNPRPRAVCHHANRVKRPAPGILLGPPRSLGPRITQSDEVAERANLRSPIGLASLHRDGATAVPVGRLFAAGGNHSPTGGREHVAVMGSGHAGR